MQNVAVFSAGNALGDGITRSTCSLYYPPRYTLLDLVYSRGEALAHDMYPAGVSSVTSDSVSTVIFTNASPRLVREHISL